MEINNIKKRNSKKINEFIPWKNSLDDKSDILVAEEKKDPVGSIKASVYKGIPWIDIKIEQNGQTVKELLKESLKILDTNKIYCLISDTDKEQKFLKTHGDIITDFKCLRGFSFPYKKTLKKISDIKPIFESEAYEKTNGLYPTKDGKIKKIDDKKNILGISEKENTKSIVILDGIKKTERNRRALFFGFTWCHPKYASQTALATRARAHEKGMDDVIICLPNNLYTTSFEQAGFNVYKKIYLYEINYSSLNQEEFK